MGHMRATIRTMLAAGVWLICTAVWPTPSLRAQPAKDLAVDVINASEPVLCAEKDNVTVKFASRHAHRFSIEAVPSSLWQAVQVWQDGTWINVPFEKHDC